MPAVHKPGGRMSGTLRGRVTVAGLLITLMVGCGPAAPGGEHQVTVPVAPPPAAPNPPPNPAPPNAAPPNPAPPNSAPPNPAPPNPAPTPTAPNPAPPKPRNPAEVRVAWMPPGPQPPAQGLLSVDDEQWSKVFKNHDCDGIAALGPERNQRQLYGALGDACRAVLRGDDRLWASVQSALRRGGSPTGCFDELAWQLLRRLVDAHLRAPQANIRIIDSTRKEKDFPCEPESSSPATTSVTSTPDSDTPAPRPPVGPRR